MVAYALYFYENFAFMLAPQLAVYMNIFIPFA